jgi:hypothetical protein
MKLLMKHVFLREGPCNLESHISIRGERVSSGLDEGLSHPLVTPKLRIRTPIFRNAAPPGLGDPCRVVPDLSNVIDWSRGGVPRHIGGHR